ncbi:hypothetical protein GM921_16200 [Pedobacter sp. LMG 31464]|uniref:Uncharacterized protein n=1 Tax=Pedobacter planticolens TaxID=2679964 RepID=A0A923DZP9_9SPHI|nr:hypothetical protein [Pedobacter planticolens]MBB2147047.1 hypothetical protein [Pedobacter planticolens]
MKDEEPIEVIHGSFTVEEDDFEPPPPEFISRFKTVNEWLSFIADNEKPKKTIMNYDINVFEGEDDYTLALTGTNTYEISNTYQRIKIEYTPNQMYFNLPKSEHKGLTKEQVFEHLTDQLNKFISSAKFKNSFFTEAKSITTGWKGKIWSSK